MNSFQISIVSLTIITSGCASITDSKNQPLSVTTTFEGKAVSGANCKLANDKGEWFTTTPGSVVIQKSYSDLSVNCRKDQQYAGTKVFSSSHEGAVWGNLLTGGIIGYAVDASSGAGFSYPPQLNVDMMENSTSKISMKSNIDVRESKNSNTQAK